MNTLPSNVEPLIRSRKDICRDHGLVVFIGYIVFRDILASASLSYWLLRLGHVGPLRRWAEEPVSGKGRAWWQDVVALVVANLTFVSVLSAWNKSGTFQTFGRYLAAYLLFDIVTFQVRSLWFDDITPGVSHQKHMVTSHRRVLFQALGNFSESVLLFAIIYGGRAPAETTLSDLVHMSFSVATCLSHPEDAPWLPLWLSDVQVMVSAFFLVVVISIVAAVGYARDELAPSVPKKCD